MHTVRIDTNLDYLTIFIRCRISGTFAVMFSKLNRGRLNFGPIVTRENQNSSIYNERH